MKSPEAVRRCTNLGRFYLRYTTSHGSFCDNKKKDTQRCLFFIPNCKPYLPLYVFIVRSAPTLTNDKIASPKSFKRSGISLFSSSEKSPRT